MRPLHFLTLLLLFNLGCQDTATPPVPVSLDGFALEAIPGAALQRAVRLDAEGQLLEEGQILNGLKTGTWIEFHPGPKPLPKRMQTYWEGKLQGLATHYSARGQIEEVAHYQNDALHGRYVKFKFGRILEDHNYQAGKLDGYFRTYYENSEQLQKEVAFKAGKEHGPYRYFNEAGKLMMEYQYENGEKMSGGMIEE